MGLKEIALTVGLAFTIPGYLMTNHFNQEVAHTSHLIEEHQKIELEDDLEGLKGKRDNANYHLYLGGSFCLLGSMGYARQRDLEKEGE